MLKNVKGRWEKFFAASIIAGALAGVKWYDPAILYHTFPPKPAANHIITDKMNQRRFTHKRLENVVGFEIRGEYSDDRAAYFRMTIEKLRAETPQLLSNVDRVVMLPADSDVPYSGQAKWPTGTVVLRTTDLSTVAHEFAHTKSFALSLAQWSEWQSVSHGHYEHEYFPPATYLEKRLEDSGIIQSKNDTEYVPRNGFVSDYGGSNPHEDLAEFVEAVHTGNDAFSKVNPKEVPLYEQKVRLLQKWGFISAENAQDAIDRLMLTSEEGAVRLIMQYADDIPTMRPIRFHPYGMELYQSKDSKLSISYGAFRDEAHLNITLFPGTGNSKTYNILPQDVRWLPAPLHHLLQSKGYLDPNAYNIERVWGKDPAMAAREAGVSIDDVRGPVPYYDAYSDHETPFYYVVRPTPTMMTVISDTP